MAEPKTLRAGDSITWTAAYSGYPASAGWTLDYIILMKDGGISGISGVATGDKFTVAITAQLTKNLTQGNFRLVGRVAKGLEKITVYDGPLLVTANLFDDGIGTDSRSQAERGLDAINAVLEGRASKDQENYAINGRSLSRTAIPDLIVLQRFYRAEIARETRAGKLAKGLPAGNTIRVRF